MSKRPAKQHELVNQIVQCDYYGKLVSVKVLAVVGAFAMVRSASNAHAMPVVVLVSDLKPNSEVQP